MVDKDILKLAERINGYMLHLLEEDEMSYSEIVDQLSEEDVKLALLAQAIADHLIDPKPALYPILLKVDEALKELVGK